MRSCRGPRTADPSHRHPALRRSFTLSYAMQLNWRAPAAIFGPWTLEKLALSGDTLAGWQFSP
jgi:hypothetical protein